MEWKERVEDDRKFAWGALANEFLFRSATMRSLEAWLSQVSRF